jgi:hypothetical protein
MGRGIVLGAREPLLHHPDSYDGQAGPRHDQQRPLPDPSLEAAFRIFTQEDAEELEGPENRGTTAAEDQSESAHERNVS